MKVTNFSSVKPFPQGELKWWRSADNAVCSLSASELQVILLQGEPKKAGRPDDWRKLT